MTKTLPTEQFPKEVADAPAVIAEPAVKYEELKRKARKAEQQIIRLEREHRAAINTDRDNAAQALVDGTPDPKRKAPAIHTKLEKARAEAQTIYDATWKARDAAVKALTDHGHQWRKQVLADRDDVAAQAKEHLDALANLEAQADSAWFIEGWTREVLKHLDGDKIQGISRRRWPARRSRKSMVTFDSTTNVQTLDDVLAKVGSYYGAKR